MISVGEQEVTDHRPELDVEAAQVGPEDTGTDEVRGDEVGCELDAVERPPEDVSQRFDRKSLGQAGDALDQEMAAGQEGHEDALQQFVLPGDHALDLEHRAFERIPDGARLGNEADGVVESMRFDQKANLLGRVNPERSIDVLRAESRVCRVSETRPQVRRRVARSALASTPAPSAGAAEAELSAPADGHQGSRGS